MTTNEYIEKDRLITEQIHDYEMDLIMHEMESTADRKKIAELKYNRRQLAQEYILQAQQQLV